ncbi:MAG: hypothetical protein R2713_06510 [Ilumatobacteraceae bacterium]
MHWHPWDNSRGGFWAVTTKDDLTTVTRLEHLHERGARELWELDAEAQAALRSLTRPTACRTRACGDC